MLRERRRTLACAARAWVTLLCAGFAAKATGGAPPPDAARSDTARFVSAPFLGLDSLSAEAAELFIDPRLSPWSVRGKTGVEVEVLAEEFGLEGLESDGTSDDLLSEVRFRDRSTRVSGLLEGSASRTGRVPIRVRGQVRAAKDRTRADGTFDASWKPSPLRFDLSNRFYGQWGDDAIGGRQNLVTLTSGWTRGERELSLACTEEESAGSPDSLGSLYEYRALRPALRLRTPLFRAGEFEVSSGIGRRWAQDPSVSDLDESWVELDWSGPSALLSRHRLEVRSHARHYAPADSLSPSGSEWTLRGETEWALLPRTRLAADASYEAEQYATNSSLYSDRSALDVSLLLRSGWEELRQGGDETTLLLRPDWRFGIGPRLVAAWYESERGRDSVAPALRVTCSRDGDERFWLDLSAEYGRRRYRTPSDAGDADPISVGGVDFSLSRTNYHYTSASLLGEVSLFGVADLSSFVQWEQEWHSLASDDFALWTFSTSLTRRF